MHAPFHSRRTLRKICEHVEADPPDVLVQLGDLYDLFSWAKFPRTENLLTPQHELEQGRKDAEEFWLRLKKAAPRAKCFQLWGNHDDRMVKRTLERAPTLEAFVKAGVRSLMQFPAVELVEDSRDELIIDDVAYMHGFRTRLGDHAAYNRHNTVCGHSHVGGVVYIKQEKRVYWELNAGFIADRFSKPLSYTAQRRFSRWTLGYGRIDELGPRFIPLDTEEVRQ